MARALFPFLILALSAYAQTPEPPVEKASSLTVVIFLVLFIGSCVGYVGYTLWTSMKKRDEAK
jgi:hypothetical protein